MLVSYKWLKEYVDITLTPQELADKITNSGIEVETVKVLNEGISGVVIGFVKEREQHPNADKLSKCLVDVGAAEPVQIICGAKNVAAGQKVAVATVGAVLPNNFKIKRAKLRGEESNGMICSLTELGVESKLIAKENAEGIFVFPSDTPVGVDALAQLNLDDAVLELSLTPNRADCLSMIGVAYEVAAVLGTDVKLPSHQVEEAGEQASDYISVRVEATTENPLYMARVIKNINIAPSPLWMQTRLMAAGIRPHNNVVDITNYVLLEYGQPLHAFDYNRLDSKEIVVRLANNERITTLDGVERTLKDELVITNGKTPVALAGVMGGANSEVREDTTTVLIESAYFLGNIVRKSAKNLQSESSTRFVKGIDSNRTALALDRAAQLMAQYAGGEVISGVVSVDNRDEKKVEVVIQTATINKKLGTTITAEEIANILNNLQFPFEQNEDTFTIQVPSRRRDITIEEDIVEEVARLYGYNNIPTTLPVTQAIPGKLTSVQAKRRQISRYLEGAGLQQAITYSLTHVDKATKYALQVVEPLKLKMPMTEERSTLRLSLIPSLLEIVAYNRARQTESIALYEISSVYLPKENVADEKKRLSGVITGTWHTHLWQGEKKAADFYVVKGILDGLFEKLGVTITYKQAKIEGMHQGRTAELFLNSESIGFVGQLHPIAQKKYDLKETYVFELDADVLLETEVESIRYTTIPRFPTMTRDMALVVDKQTVAGEIQATIVEVGGGLLKSVSIFDLYEGERLETGKKSIAYSLKYFDPERTLTDEEVTKVHSEVVKAVEKKFGAVLRG